MQSSSIQPLQLLKKIQDYIFNLQDKIGEGSFSRVYKGNNINSQMTVAVKKIRISDIKSKIARRLLECEVTILRQVSHPTIIKCHDIHFSINNCYLITQFCEGGNVFELLQREQELKMATINKIIVSVVQALSYLAHLGIVHRDIKVSNVFITADNFKVGDFGFAIKATSSFRDVSIGSPVYMSPQGLIHHMYGPKTDIWALGILIYQLFHRATPLQNCKSEEQLRKRVVELPSVSANMPQDLRQLMMGCLCPSEPDRLSIKEIVSSSYIRRVRGEFQSLAKSDKQQSSTNYSTVKTFSFKTAPK